jgi:hypothetical protein
MKLLIFIIYFLSYFIANSQVTVDNDKAHRRYWYYRTRMINDFMKIGKEQGNCVVLSERNAIYHADGIESSSTGPDQIDITNQYIMALALEYKLLTRNNQDASETIKEIFHLLWALNRLDLEAEQFFDAIEPANDHIQANGILNGFMLREDMPKDYFESNNNQNLLHYNYSLLENGYSSNSTNFSTTYGGFTGIFHSNKQSTDNFFSDHFSQGNAPRNKMTLPTDKYHTILIAMMFINKYMPSNVTYNGEAFQDGETSLKQEARNIAIRCYDYCNGPNDLWVLKLINSNGNEVGNLPVGGSAFVYSWPLSRDACKATSNFPWSIGGNNSSCYGYNDAYAITSGKISYNLMTNTPNPCFEDNSVFKAWSHAGSNSPASSIPICLLMQPNTTLNNLEWAEILRKVLHQDGALLRQLSIYGDVINTAPCQGPYNYSECNHGGWEWSSQDRLEHPDARGANCNGHTKSPIPCVAPGQNFDSGFYGNYPGVDYMLLHNLYYEYQNQLLDGNQGNVGNAAFGNITTVIYNAANTVGSSLVSAGCSAVNAISGFFNGSTTLCNPTNTSGNGGAGSNNVNVVGYYPINFMDNKDENIWPRQMGSSGTMPIQGNSDLPAKVSVFQNLSSIAHIYATSSPAAISNTLPSDVIYRAGKEIVLLPGFQVDYGSTFRAHIQRYLCSGNNDPMILRKLQDSSIVLEELDYETDMINPIPIHYMESPKSDADNNPIIPEDYDVENYITEIQPLDYPKTSEFNISPNPTTGKVKIQTKKSIENEAFSIHVYDMKGLLIYIYENVSSDFEINLEGFSKGIYMVRVTSSLGNNITKKIDLID